MAASKKKQIKQGGMPPGRNIRQGGEPDSIMSLHPSWNFSSCDTDVSCAWSFCKERLNNDFWDKIFPKLREFESMTWAEILVSAKKQNHSNEIVSLNKGAQDRLQQLCIEADSLQSLRLGGNLRLYGYTDKAVYNILWYDNNHGDNDTCVYQSRLKHT